MESFSIRAFLESFSNNFSHRYLKRCNEEERFRTNTMRSQSLPRQSLRQLSRENQSNRK